jgi:cell division protein FtsB
MRRFFRKKSIHKLYSWPVLVILLAFLVSALYWTWGAYQKRAASLEALGGTKRVWEQYKDREAKLTEDIDKLETSRGLEEEIRERFSVAKEGEKMAIIVDDRNSVEETTPPKEGFWDSIMEIFQSP